jgi:hypothetical protein
MNEKIIKLNVKTRKTYSKDKICFTHLKTIFKVSNYKLSMDFNFFSHSKSQLFANNCSLNIERLVSKFQKTCQFEWKKN